MVAGARRLPVRRFAGEHGTSTDDEVAAEAPLEIQVFDGAAFRSLAVLMRSPDDEDDDDGDLVTGFLVTEGIVKGAADIEDVRACDVAPSADAEGNVWRVRLREGLGVDWARLQRNTYVSSSCGVCGKASIDNACAVAPPVVSDVVVAPVTLLRLSAALRARQPTFDRTGGLHGALLATAAGDVVVAREDVGRHNAVDKAIGHALRAGARADVLLVSGRISFELVQKALAARVPVVAGVSAPTSLAVELGERAGVTVVGFVRGDGLNVYACADRVRV